jgi:hypothetical protein
MSRPLDNTKGEPPARELPAPPSSRARQARQPKKPDGLDPKTRERLLEKDDSGRTLFDREKCAHCGGLHLRTCPRVKRLLFAERGQHVVEVEFWPSGQWPEQDIIWPEQVFEDEEESTDG